ncbi:ABC transporter permease [bacterium]|nr:ABC transporter permease [bacterium]
MKKFFEIIKSEFFHFINEPAALLIMVIGVIAYAVFYSLPYSSEIIKEAPIGIVDMDSSDLSREFIRNIDTTDSLDVVYTAQSKQDAENQFYKNKIKGFIIIPKDFEKDILRGKQTDISLYADTSYLIIYKTIYSATAQTALETAAKFEVGALMKKGFTKQTAMAVKQPFKFVQIPVYNAAGGYETYVYLVILIMILHQTLIVGLGIMQGTRNENNEPYCAKEENIGFVMFSRSTFYVLLYMFYSAVYFLIIPVFCHLPVYYNILPFSIVLLLMFYAAAFFSHTISYVFKTRESAFLIMVVTSLLFVFLTGLIWPREAMPDLINIISAFIPSTLSVDALIKIAYAKASLWDVKYDVLWIIILVILYYYTGIKALIKSKGEQSGNNN